MKDLFIRVIEERILRGNTVVGAILIGIAIYDHVKGSHLLEAVSPIVATYLVAQKG